MAEGTEVNCGKRSSSRLLPAGFLIQHVIDLGSDAGFAGRAKDPRVHKDEGEDINTSEVRGEEGSRRVSVGQPGGGADSHQNQEE